MTRHQTPTTSAWTPGSHTDDPSLPIDVRAARAWARAGGSDNDGATALRFAVREAIGDLDYPTAERHLTHLLTIADEVSA